MLSLSSNCFPVVCFVKASCLRVKRNATRITSWRTSCWLVLLLNNIPDFKREARQMLQSVLAFWVENTKIAILPFWAQINKEQELLEVRERDSQYQETFKKTFESQESKKTRQKIPFFMQSSMIFEDSRTSGILIQSLHLIGKKDLEENSSQERSDKEIVFDKENVLSNTVFFSGQFQSRHRIRIQMLFLSLSCNLGTQTLQGFDSGMP